MRTEKGFFVEETLGAYLIRKQLPYVVAQFVELDHPHVLQMMHVIPFFGAPHNVQSLDDVEEFFVACPQYRGRLPDVYTLAAARGRKYSRRQVWDHEKELRAASKLWPEQWLFYDGDILELHKDSCSMFLTREPCPIAAFAARKPRARTPYATPSAPSIMRRSSVIYEAAGRVFRDASSEDLLRTLSKFTVRADSDGAWCELPDGRCLYVAVCSAENTYALAVLINQLRRWGVL